MIILVVFFLTALVYLYLMRWIQYKEFNSLPGPPALPLLGNILDVGTNGVAILKNLTALTNKYGDVFRVWLGPFNPTIIVTNPKFIEEILSSTVHIKKSTTYLIFKSFLGDGLISSMGDQKWKVHRKLLTPAFHYKILEKFIDTFEDLGRILIEKFNENVGKDSFNVFPYINRYTLDVICETSMGVTLDIQTHPDHEYLRCMVDYERLFTNRQFSLIGRKENLYQLTPQSRTFNALVSKMKKFTENVIKQKRILWDARETKTRTNEFGMRSKQSFLELLLELQDDNKITTEEIREEVDTFMFAGHDTTSSALSFALYELAKRPDLQEKILEEFNSNIGPNKNDPVTFNNLQNLKYTECVIKEAMRLRSTVPLIERGVHDDLKIDGKTIPKGTTIVIFIYGLHNSEKYFDEPSKFIPERFLPENTVDRNPYTYIPFSAGMRNCIGQKFALLEMKATLAKIIKNFVLYPAVPEHNVILSGNAIIKSYNEIPIRVKPRI